MHRTLIRQLEAAVTEVFAEMLNLACTPGAQCDRRSAVGYTACVAFRGRLEGMCLLEIDERTAAYLTSSLTGIPVREIPPELCADTTGELCNMIAGSWKTRHPPELAASHLSCPVVTRGSQPDPAGEFRHSVTLTYCFDGNHISLLLALN